MDMAGRPWILKNLSFGWPVSVQLQCNYLGVSRQISWGQDCWILSKRMPAVGGVAEVSGGCSGGVAAVAATSVAAAEAAAVSVAAAASAVASLACCPFSQAANLAVLALRSS